MGAVADLVRDVYRDFIAGFHAVDNIDVCAVAFADPDLAERHNPAVVDGDPRPVPRGRAFLWW